MSEIFPLTEELWLDWLKDEKHLISLPRQKQYVTSLLEKAVQDYMSVRIWIEYCQHIMDSIESSSGMDAVRNIYEKAVTAVGLHLTEGSSIWDSYREFETEILQSYQTLYSVENAGTSLQKIDDQISRVNSLFRRQLAVPLLGMQRTMQEYEDWTSEPIAESVDKAYQKALSKLEKCVPLEDALSTATLPKQAEYEAYINMELKDGDPARIQCIYERAIKDNCLDANLWEQYTEYLDNKLKVASVAVPVHKRAVRNCPWVVKLWISYIKALELNKTDHITVKESFEKALGCGFGLSEDYVALWITYCDYMKRRIASWEEDTEKVEDLRKTFENAINYIDHYFGSEGDKTSVLRRYWAMIEAKFLGNLRKAQELWDAVMKIHSKETHMWLEYTHFLRLHDDVISCRRAFQRAVQTSVDDPEQICEAFLSFERIEGTFEQLESATQRCENQLKKFEGKRQKGLESETLRAKERAEKNERQKQAKLQKNKQNRKLGKQEQQERNYQQESGKAQGKDVSKRKLPVKEQSYQEPPAKKTKGHDTEETEKLEEKSLQEKMELGENEESSRTKTPSFSEDSKENTVFLSNLLFNTTDEDIKKKFNDCGEIKDVRIAHNQLGRSKGFAYLEFTDQKATEKALQLDRALLNGRPVFVSPCLDKSKDQQPKFRYSMSLDKNTVYVTNIPFELKKEDLEEIFKKIGDLKEVRIVTNRAGKSKGFAYIEYNDEASASTAVLKLDGQTVKGRPINVAISKAPARKENAPQPDQRPEQRKRIEHGSRGRAKTQVSLVPRSIHTHATTKATSKPEQKKERSDNEERNDEKRSDEQNELPNVKRSNDDFRKLFAK
eukprot:Seg1574.20 transcript_id=Seg1574.20/GoldUCD/mRNA.D3Y31 product="Squamous cell carcinoma antigen recognized by T-cells 3" protein_id=Seg1574.20/GoldUCD/D3Y31